MTDKNSTDYGPRYLVGYGKETPDPRWPGGAKLAVQLVLNYEEGSESTVVNGDDVSTAIASELGPGKKPMPARDVNIESLYEYGSRAGVWRLLRLFKEFDVKCTVYANGQALEMNPAVAQDFVKEGHEIASHGYRWVDRSKWTEEEEADQARKAISAIKKHGGQHPRGWYYGMVESAAAERSRSMIARVFKEEQLELKYWSDDYSDDLPHYIPYPGGAPEEALLIVPYTMDVNDYKMGTAQSYVAPDDFSSYLIATFDELLREGNAGHPKMMSVGLHPRLVGRPARVAALRKFLEHATARREEVWFATREEIADHWRESNPYRPGKTPL